MHLADDSKPPLIPLRQRALALWRPLILLGLMGLVCWSIGHNAATGYRWQWYRVWHYLGTFGEDGFVPGLLLKGLLTTVQLTGASLVLALGIGMVLAAMRLSPSPVARLMAGALLGAIRNTPLLMQLFMVYFVLAPMLGLGQFAAATLALAAFEGSYMAEVFRAGMVSIPKAQWEAAISLGMSVPLAARLIIIPQALRNILAPLTSQIISLIKDTSLVGSIAVADLTMRTRVIITETFLSFELWLLTAAIYLVLTLLVSIPALWLERRPLTS